MKLILVRSHREDIVAVSGLWTVKDYLKIVRLVPDAFIIFPGEIMMIINDDVSIDFLKKLRTLEKMLSLSTTLARLRRALGTDKRIFVSISAIVDDYDDLSRAAYCGGADGILHDVELRDITFRDDTVQLIPINSVDSQYIAVKYDELAKVDLELVKRAHGLIIYLDFRPSLNMLRCLREKCITLYGKSRIIVAVPHIYLSYSLIKRARDIIYGVAITSFGRPIRLDYVDYSREIFLYRCSECRRDLVSSSIMRKCPRCGQRLIELLKEPSERYFKYTARELRYIFMNMLKIVEKGVIVDYYGY